jgi:hypothetical protein
LSKALLNIVIEWVRNHGLEGARLIARHLPPPDLDQDGGTVIPELLDLILREFDADQVYQRFAASVHGLESWWGNGADAFRGDPEIAKKFLVHPNPPMGPAGNRRSPAHGRNGGEGPC